MVNGAQTSVDVEEVVEILWHGLIAFGIVVKSQSSPGEKVVIFVSGISCCSC